jgi:hypothetical protein
LYHRTDYKTYEEQLEIARRMRETAYPSLELRREARHASVSGMLRQQFASEPNPVTAFFPREVLDPVQQQRYDGLENYRDQCARLPYKIIRSCVKQRLRKPPLGKLGKLEKRKKLELSKSSSKKLNQRQRKKISVV